MDNIFLLKFEKNSQYSFRNDVWWNTVNLFLAFLAIFGAKYKGQFKGQN